MFLTVAGGLRGVTRSNVVFVLLAQARIVAGVVRGLKTFAEMTRA